MVGVVYQTVSNYVVQHLQVVLAQLVKISHFRSDIFVLLLDDSPEEVVFEGLQKITDFVADQTQFVHEMHLVLNIASISFLLPQTFLVYIQQFPTLRQQILAVTESQYEGEYLHVFGEMDVGEDGLEDGGQGGELETYVVV